MNIAHLRLHHQQLLHSALDTPQAVVGWMGAMQAQDYPMSKWAVGSRLPGSTDASIEQAINRGDIVRTHILRPTWHLVAATDIRWMLALSAPNVMRALETYTKQLGLTEDVRLKSNRLIAKMLEGRQMTREEIMAELQQAGIQTDDLRPAHLMFSAELEGIVCNGAVRGKQQTYALLDERVPPAPHIPKEEALARLALRYFRSHGPATLRDYVWWSGLRVADARAGLEAAKSELHSLLSDGQEYWMAEPPKTPPKATDSLLLLPAFDEFMVSYTNRSASLEARLSSQAITGNGIFKPIVVVYGQVVGLWKRTVKKASVALEFQPLSAAYRLPERAEMAKAADAFGKFLGLPADIA